MEELKRKEGENLLDYYKRITLNRKLYDADYKEWGDSILGESNNYSSDNLRKAFYVMEKMFKKLEDENIENIDDESLMNQVKEIIGELDIKKQEIKNKTSQLNKIKRNFVKTIEISNDLKEIIHKEIDRFPQFSYKPMTCLSNNKLVVIIGDWHVGYVINDYKGNSYNYQIVNKRLGLLVSEIINACNLYEINDVVVINCGDTIENTYMRQNQSYECEFDLSEQIVKATQLIFSFISDISKLANVEYYSVGGNHSRMNGNKDANLEGDNANVIINETLKSFVNMSDNKRITIGTTDYKDDSCVFNVNNLRFKAIHGDNRVRDGKKLFDAESTMDDEKYDVIIRGHDHNFNVTSQNNGGYVITNGCLFGYNPYSIKKMSCSTIASQTLMVINNKVEMIKDVNLQVV